MYNNFLPIPHPPHLPSLLLLTLQEYILVAEACWQREPGRRPPMERVLATLTTLLGVVQGRGEAAPAGA